MTVIAIRFGYKESGTFLGSVAYHCPFCQTVQAFRCFGIARAQQISGITVGSPVPYSKRLVCVFCNETMDFYLQVPLQIDPHWDPRFSLQALVNSTNPGLGVLPPKNGCSQSEVRAVLLRSDEWVRFSFHNEGNLGCLFGVIGAATLILGICIGAAIPPPSDPNHPVKSYAIIFGVPFTVVVLLVSYLLARRFLLVSRLSNRLKEFGNFFQISRSMYEEALNVIPSCPQRLKRAVSKLPSSLQR